jgi:hypothetical protein
MDLELKENQLEKSNSDNPFSLDSRDVSNVQKEGDVFPKEINNENRLEINIIKETETYQEIEVIYGNKKRLKRITKFLPKNFATFIYEATCKPTPSMKIGAVNSVNLSTGLQDDGHMLLQEKFLRVIAKINKISSKTPENIWDSEERINTTEKAILLAVANCNRPQSEQLDRVIISMRSTEIPEQKAFQKFISEVVDLTKNSEKLIEALFSNLAKNLSQEHKENLSQCLKNIVSENQNSEQNYQIKILQKVVNENYSAKQSLRDS